MRTIKFKSVWMIFLLNIFLLSSPILLQGQLRKVNFYDPNIGFTYKNSAVEFNSSELLSKPVKELVINSTFPEAMSLDCSYPIKSLKSFKLYTVFETVNSYKYPISTFPPAPLVLCTLKVSLSYYKYGITTPITITPQTVDLIIDPTKPEKTNIIDFFPEVRQNKFDKIAVSILSFNNGALPSNNTYKLRCYYEEEYEYDFSYILSSPASVSNSTISISSDTSQVTFNWNNCSEAPSYEFQLLRLYNSPTCTPTCTTSTNSNPQIIKTVVDWTKALTIETGNSTKSITLTMVEGSGYYIWRVRPIGNAHNAGIEDPRNLGVWSIADNTYSSTTPFDVTANVSNSSGGNILFYYTQFNRDLNWIYGRIFSEGNPNGGSQFRLKEQMTYANGLQQTQQSQVKLQSTQKVMASQTIYDYSGRPALTTLAAPITKSPTNDVNKFGYKTNYILAGTTTPHIYSAVDFDADGNSTATPAVSSTYDNPLTVNSTSQLVQYYDGNTDVSIPSSEGYPFSRVLYAKDGTNRPRESSSPGETFGIGKGHTVTVSYSGVTNTELIRIFGDEAPIDSTVYKTMTTDANKTTSVAYVSMSGKTIATCLDGNGGGDQYLEPLTGATFDVSDIITSSNTALGTNGLIAFKTLSLSTEKLISFSYKINPKLYNQLCANYCKTCDYKVVVRIISKEDPENNFKPPHEFEILPQGADESCSTGTITPPNSSWSYTLPAGDYVIERRIVAHNKVSSAVDADYYIDVQTNKMKNEIVTLSDNLLNPIRTLLNAEDLDGLYTYLNANYASKKDGNTYKLDFYLKTGQDCKKINIPIIPCDPVSDTLDFEHYFENYWSSKGNVFVAKSSNGGVITTTNIAVPNGVVTVGNDQVLAYMPYYKHGEFNTMMYNMLHDTKLASDGTSYNAVDVINAWKSAVKSYGQFLSMDGTSPASSSASLTTTTTPINPNNMTYHADLLEEFLKAVGKKMRFFSNSAYSGDYNTPGFLSHAYCCFNPSFHTLPYTASDYLTHNYLSGISFDPLDHSSCQHIADNDFSNTKIDWSDISGFIGTDGYVKSNGTVTDYTKWKNYYGCVMNTIPTVLTTSQANTYLLEFQNNQHQMSDKTCEGRAQEFEDAIAQKMHDESPNYPTYITGYDNFTLIKYTIGTDYHYYPSNTPAPASPSNTKTKAELDCYTMSLVNLCKEKSKLFIAPNSTAMGNMLTLGTSTEIASVNNILNGKFDIVLNQIPCTGVGYMQTGNTASMDTLQKYVNYLNSNILTISDCGNATCSYNWYSILPNKYGGANNTNFIVINHATIPANEFVPIVNYYPHGVSYFSVKVVGSMYYLYFTSYDILDPDYDADEYSRGLYTNLVAKGDISTRGTCPLCVKFYEPANFSGGDPIELNSCKKETCKYISQLIETQVGEIFSTYPAELEQSYNQNCLSQYSIDDELKITYNLGYHHYTLYYYDRAGNLVRTVPPKGVVTLGATATRSDHPQHKFVTEYEYNSLGQLIRQNTPDGGESKFYYNNVGMLRFSQNAKQIANLFSYTKYDALGRIIEVGQVSGLTESTIKAQLLTETNFDAETYPATNTTQRTITKYSEPLAGVVYMGNKTQRFLNNRVSYVYTDEDGDLGTTNDQWYTFYSYDPHGNVEWLVQQDPKLGRNYVAYEYDLINGHVLKVKYNEGKVDQFFHRYKYDEDGRITQAQTSVDGAIWDKDASYNYYLHGPLKRTLIGEDSIQGLDYVYTLQGWLKSINHSSLSQDNDPGLDGKNLSNNPNRNVPQDIFGMSLSYYRGDFKHTGSPFEGYAAGYLDNNDYNASSNVNGRHDLYNGNISCWESNINSSSLGTTGMVYTGRSGRIFKYDQLNRLINADFYSSTAGTPTTWNTTSAFDETFSYDANGNILNLKRNDGEATISQVDNLNYTYDAANYRNRLSTVIDVSGYTTAGNDIKGTSTYTYDAIGNLISYVNNGVSTVEWNVYGKVSKVTKTDGKVIVFHYDAMGNRVSKDLFLSSTATSPDNTVYYVRDASGNPMATYKRTNTTVGSVTTANFTLQEMPIYGSDRIGMLQSELVVKSKVYTAESDLLQVYDGLGVNSTASGFILTSNMTANLQSRFDNIPYQTITNQPQIIVTQSGVTSPVSSVVNMVMPGVVGGCRSVALDEYGGMLLYFEVYKKTTNTPFEGILFNSASNLVAKSSGIFCDPYGQSIMTKDPGNPSQYYLFTSKEGKIYYHIIDVVNNQVIEMNKLFTDATGYLPTMSLIEDYTGNGINQLYLMRVNTAQSKTEVIAVAITANGLGQPTVLSSITDGGNSKAIIALSPDAKYIAATTVSTTTPILTKVKIFNLSKDHRSVTDKSNLTVVDNSNELVDNICFSHNSAYLYFSKKSTIDKKLRRLNVATSTVESGSLGTITGDIIRGEDNTMYTINSNILKKVVNCEAASVTLQSAITLSGITSAAQKTITQAITLGWISKTKSNTFARSIGNKLYELKDHLGNVNVVIKDFKKQSGSSLLPEIASISNYYAFGSEMPHRVFPNATYPGASYKYGFNGKEKDDELKGSGNSYDFGARIYDPRIGRWLAVDLSAKKYPGTSPFHFGFNNPIIVIDPDGKENVIVVGRQNSDGVAQGQTFANQLMFLDNAMTIAAQYKEQNNGEKTTILLIATDYTTAQIEEYSKKAIANGAELQLCTDDNELIKYINNRETKSTQVPPPVDDAIDGNDNQTSTRDLITDFTYIGHGFSMGLQMGNMFKGEMQRYNLLTSELAKIDKNAFSKNSVSNLIGCYTGKEGKEWTIAAEFSKLTNISIGSNQSAYFIGGGKFTWQEGYSIFKNGKLIEKTTKNETKVLISSDKGTEAKDSETH